MDYKKEGLTAKEVNNGLKKHGYNEIKDSSKVTPLKILLRQVKGNMIFFLLLAAMIISFFVGKYVTGYTLIVVILLVVLTGFFQEYRAEKAISSLKKLVNPLSIVFRDGKETEIPSREIVPGDIIVLRNGEKIPCDCVVLEQKDLLVNESVLTGESKEVQKITYKKGSYDEENFLYMGSFIVNGKCIAKAVHTGMHTKFGKIANMISKAEKELPLQKKVNRIAKIMSFIAITVAILTGLVVLADMGLSKASVIEVLILVIAISVSAFPEGLPVVLISTLSLGAYKMSKKNAIVNRMSIIETLGETTVICSDKTGTITKGEMTVKKIFTGRDLFKVTGAGYESKGDFFIGNKRINPEREENLKLLLKAGTVCNDAIIKPTEEGDSFSVIGSPTEAAVKVAAAKAGIYLENLNIMRVDENPFSSERKLMSVLIKENGKKTVYVKGALEMLIGKCKYIKKEEGVYRLLERDKERILHENKKMNSDCLRTLSFAYKETDSKNPKTFEQDLIFLGTVGMEDPPRAEVIDSLQTCKVAGISVKMITGDNKETAISIAEQINLGKGRVLEGKDLDSISDEELRRIVSEVIIFARVKPEHKLRIVKALKENGEVVTMTGDGVNDAPALKEAHVGVAMGRSGTDVSRNVADLTLRDDNFASIVAAIKEGRTIFSNIRKFVTYQLSCNYAELTVLFLGSLLVPIFGWPVPLLLSLQILFMNLITDNLPAITLGFNLSSEDIMKNKPKKDSNILSRNFLIVLLFNGLLMAFITLSTFYITFNILGQEETSARTTALITLILVEIAGAFNFRSFRKGTLNKYFFANIYLVIASSISIIATIIIVYTSANKIFGTAPLPVLDWIIALGVGLLFIILYDVLKAINKRKKFINLS